MKQIAVAACALAVWGGAFGQTSPATRACEWNVLDFGAAPDGVTDNSAAFQKAMEAARADGGGVVWAPAGRYAFTESLTIPGTVTLRGTYTYAPAHAGIRDAGAAKPEDGTVLLCRVNRGKEDGPPFIMIEGNATLQGALIYYPDQDPRGPAPTPYPFCVAMRGNNPAILDVELLNPYKAIDASKNQRALIRNIHGQPLRLGVFVDEVYDIGRIENVHWNPWWSMDKELFQWQMDHGEAFVFGRTDWHYALNTFCFGYHIGYKFIETKSGVCNGNFLGIGADDCQTALVVEQSAPYGLLITNGEFVSFHGPDPTMIRVEKTNRGSVRFNNCAFWGPCNRIAVIDGEGTVGFGDCTFVQWAHHGQDLPAIDAQGGSVMVRGCEFREPKWQVRLGEGVARAIVSENFIAGPKRIVNESKGQVYIGNNLAKGR